FVPCQRPAVVDADPVHWPAPARPECPPSRASIGWFEPRFAAEQAIKQSKNGGAAWPFPRPAVDDWVFIKSQRLAHPRMNAVGIDDPRFTSVEDVKAGRLSPAGAGHADPHSVRYRADGMDAIADPVAAAAGVVGLVQDTAAVQFLESSQGTIVEVAIDLVRP